MPKFEKGSQEAKDYMASIRAKRGKGKASGKGVNDPAPPPTPAFPPSTRQERPRRPPPLDLTEAQRIQHEEAVQAVAREIVRAEAQEMEGQGAFEGLEERVYDEDERAWNRFDPRLESSDDRGELDRQAEIQRRREVEREREAERRRQEMAERIRSIVREADAMTNPYEQMFFVRSQQVFEDIPEILMRRLLKRYDDPRGLVGAGIFDEITKKLKRTVNKAGRRLVNKGGRHVVNKAVTRVKNATERTSYPPKVRKLIASHGKKVIASAVINRKPVEKKITGLLNVLSLGQFKKNIDAQPYDDLFHLSIVLNTTDGKRIMIEKNEVINMAMTPNKGGETYPITPFSTGKTLGEVMENTRKKMGDTKFFSYSAKNNNCQDFIMALLQANGMGDADEFAFVKQDTKKMFKGLKTLSKVADFVTDMAGTADGVIKGRGAASSCRKNPTAVECDPEEIDIDFDDSSDEEMVPVVIKQKPVPRPTKVRPSDQPIIFIDPGDNASAWRRRLRNLKAEMEESGRELRMHGNSKHQVELAKMIITEINAYAAAIADYDTKKLEQLQRDAAAAAERIREKQLKRIEKQKKAIADAKKQSVIVRNSGAPPPPAAFFGDETGFASAAPVSVRPSNFSSPLPSGMMNEEDEEYDSDDDSDDDGGGKMRGTGVSDRRARRTLFGRGAGASAPTGEEPTGEESPPFHLRPPPPPAHPPLAGGQMVQLMGVRTWAEDGEQARGYNSYRSQVYQIRGRFYDQEGDQVFPRNFIPTNPTDDGEEPNQTYFPNMGGRGVSDRRARRTLFGRGAGASAPTGEEPPPPPNPTIPDEPNPQEPFPPPPPPFQTVASESVFQNNDILRQIGAFAPPQRVQLAGVRTDAVDRDAPRGFRNYRSRVFQTREYVDDGRNFTTRLTGRFYNEEGDQVFPDDFIPATPSLDDGEQANQTYFPNMGGRGFDGGGERGISARKRQIRKLIQQNRDARRLIK